MEGSPNSAKESICCETPVLSLNVGDVQTIVHGDINSKVFDTFEDLKKYCKNLSFDKNIVLGRSSRDIIEKNGYSSEIIANKLIDIYRS
jgi:glycosyltransferase involved in cell wall biosynthesis